MFPCCCFVGHVTHNVTVQDITSFWFVNVTASHRVSYGLIHDVSPYLFGDDMKSDPGDGYTEEEK